MFTNYKKVFIAAFALIVVVVMSMFFFKICSGKKYKVDYCGQKYAYSNAKDSYKAGTEVKLYFELIATDTDYSFYLDDERLNYDYDEKKGFIISFVMPEHDVKLECESHNSMLPYNE